VVARSVQLDNGGVRPIIAGKIAWQARKETGAVKPPDWLERWRHPEASARGAAGVDELDPIDAAVALEPIDDAIAPEPLDEAAVMEELEALLPADEALQEIAEQTAYGAVLLEDLIRRQLMLAFSVAAVFLVILFGLPLMNLAFPELVQMRVLGLPMSWLALAVLVYPFVWALAVYFVSTSKKNEDEFTELVR
jgi:uncharacterized membrane protein (DUF485 family)